MIQQQTISKVCRSNSVSYTRPCEHLQVASLLCAELAKMSPPLQSSLPAAIAEIAALQLLQQLRNPLPVV